MTVPIRGTVIGLKRLFVLHYASMQFQRAVLRVHHPMNNKRLSLLYDTLPTLVRVTSANGEMRSRWSGR